MLNGKTMQYRAKSPGRALAEIETLTRTYGVKRVECVDNILDMRYFESFLPALIRKDLGLDMYYETKANLRHDQLQLMRDAGVRRIVPGIESFSNQVLRLIRKGSTGLQNIQLLKWCAEVGITPKIQCNYNKLHPHFLLLQYFSSQDLFFPNSLNHIWVRCPSIPQRENRPVRKSG